LKNLRAVQSPTQNGKTLEELCLWEGDVYKLTAVYDGTAYWQGKDSDGRDIYDYEFEGSIGNREERFRLRKLNLQPEDNNFRYATPVEIAQYRSKYEF
jgi:hypothetical protein